MWSSAPEPFNTKAHDKEQTFPNLFCNPFICCKNNLMGQNQIKNWSGIEWNRMGKSRTDENRRENIRKVQNSKYFCVTVCVHAKMCE